MTNTDKALVAEMSHILKLIEEWAVEINDEDSRIPLDLRQRAQAAIAKAAPLPPDPEDMNDDRAGWADAALRKFQYLTGTDDEDALTDLLGDLMHWCDRNDSDFERALSMARMHYEAETTPPEEV